MSTGKPMTHDDLTQMLGRAIADPAFRAKLLADPKATIAAEGFAPTDAAVHFFDSLKTHGFDAAANKVAVKGKHDPIELAGDM